MYGLRNMEKIELSDASQEDCLEYVEYRVIHEDGTEGSADLRIRELRESPLAYNLRDEGLPNDALIAELFLYPHSKTSSERTGVGSRTLGYILKDAAERNIRLVFAECTSLAARSFFQKKGFKGNYAPHCYVVL